MKNPDRRHTGDRTHLDFRHSSLSGPVQGEGIQHNYFGTTTRAPAQLPHQVGVIPSPAGCFQSRAEAARISATLAGGGTAIVGPASGLLTGGVLAGMGGVGKTQLTADYARSAWRAGELDVLVWTSASSATEAASGYAQAGIELLGAEPARAAQAFLAHLEPGPQQKPWRWLIVLDDVTSPADLNGLWPPASPYGRTLVTTRRKDAALTHEGRRLIEVGLFTPDESHMYLTTALASRDRAEPHAQLSALAEELGHLPLALSQVSAIKFFPPPTSSTPTPAAPPTGSCSPTRQRNSPTSAPTRCRTGNPTPPPRPGGSPSNVQTGSGLPGLLGRCFSSPRSSTPTASLTES